jgi:hypothetical protein
MESKYRQVHPLLIVFTGIFIPLIFHLGWLQVYTPLHLMTERHLPKGAIDAPLLTDEPEKPSPTSNHRPHSPTDHTHDLVQADLTHHTVATPPVMVLRLERLPDQPGQPGWPLPETLRLRGPPTV